MKNSKLLKSLIALSCVLTMGLGVVTGCGGEPECEHVYNVVETIESTCTQNGKQTSACAICGDIKTVDLPINENAHVFTGEWQITQPTEEADGLAYKTCVNNPEHKTEVVLPKLTITGKGYDEKEFITVPTTAREGEIKLTLKNTYGDITFTAPLAKRKLNNMEDAVILASSLKENVRQADGWIQETKDGLQQNFSYYFGEDYTYIKDDINTQESWYSLDDDGNVFAMSKKDGSSIAMVDPDSNKGYLNGFFYNSTVNTSTFYGAEEGLARLYETAMSGIEDGTTVNYQQIDEVKTQLDGSLKDLWFSYSYYSSGWFARFYVQFSSYRDGTLKELKVETEIIRSYMYVQDLDGSIVTYKEGDESVVSGKAVAGDIIFAYDYPINYSTGAPLYATDSEGEYVYEYVNKATGKVAYKEGNDYYEVTDGEKIDNGDGTYSYNVIRQKLDYVPELEPVYIKDKFGMTVLDDKGNPIPKIMAANGYPVESYYSDDHSEVSYKTVHIEQTKKTENDVVVPNPYPSNSRYISDFEITGATSNGIAIDLSNGLVLPTNRPIIFTIGNITPSSATLNSDAIENIYVKDNTGALIKLKFDFNNGSQYKILSFFTPSEGTITVNSQYAGELTLVFETASGKCKKEVSMTFEKSAPSALTAMADVYTVTNGEAGYKESVVSLDKPVNLIVGQSLIFRAAALSSEAAYVSTDIYPSCSQTGLTFTQTEEGGYEEWELVADRAGEYVVKMPYFDGTDASATVYAQFKVVVGDGVDVMQKLSGNTFIGKVLVAQSTGNPKSKTLTAEFTLDGKINIEVDGNEIVYTYSEDVTTGKLVTAWESGLDHSVRSYDFEFSINEAGDLVLTHSTGMGNNTEDKVLTKVVDVMKVLTGNTFEGEVSVLNGLGDPKLTTLTAEFTADGKINIRVDGNDIVYTYGVGASMDELVTAWESGIEPTQTCYDFSFSVNENEELIISHGTGVGSSTESIVLTKVTAE